MTSNSETAAGSLGGQISTAGQPLLCLRDIAKTFRLPTERGGRGLRATAHRAVDDLSITVHRGDLFDLLGPSGCGKSTDVFISVNTEKKEGQVGGLHHRTSIALPGWLSLPLGRSFGTGTPVRNSGQIFAASVTEASSNPGRCANRFFIVDGGVAPIVEGVFGAANRIYERDASNTWPEVGPEPRFAAGKHRYFAANSFRSQATNVVVNNRGHFLQHFLSQSLDRSGQPTTLVVGERQVALAELLPHTRFSPLSNSSPAVGAGSIHPATAIRTN